MASIRRQIDIAAAADTVWSALRDVGALQTRLVRGFVTDCRLEGDTRIVTFANGIVASERIVSVDEIDRRVVWSAAGGRLSHHNASAQVVADPGGDAATCRVVWICDLLPDAMAPAIASMIEDGLRAMRRSLGGGAASASRAAGTS